MKSLLARATLVVVMIAGLVILELSPLLVAGQAGEAVSVTKQVQPTNPNMGDEVTINLTLTGSNTLCPPQVVTGAPLDVALVIDHSGSMENIIA